MSHGDHVRFPLPCFPTGLLRKGMTFSGSILSKWPPWRIPVSKDLRILLKQFFPLLLSISNTKAAAKCSPCFGLFSHQISSSHGRQRSDDVAPQLKNLPWLPVPREYNPTPQPGISPGLPFQPPLPSPACQALQSRWASHLQVLEQVS